MTAIKSAAIFLAVLLFAYMAIAQSPLPLKPLPPKGTFVDKPSPWDTRIIELDIEAVDTAYRDQMHHLFLGWMKDDTDQPDRAIRGAQQARRAYILVRAAIEERAKQLRELK